MRRRLALAAVVFLATIGWLAVRDIRRSYWHRHIGRYLTSTPPPAGGTPYRD
jgi:hypothetical protein